METKINRRTAFKRTGALAGAGLLSVVAGCEKAPDNRAAAVATAEGAGAGPNPDPNAEYVWLSANANLPLFRAHDHPALHLAGRHFGVRVTIAGPNSIDIPRLVADFEQTAARRPAGIMVVGWDPSALIRPINQAVETGIPVVCVDADVPNSKRLAFIGTDWRDLGIRQAEAMVKALRGRTGKVALLGLIDQVIDQQAFDGFRFVAEKAGLTCLEPQHDKGNQAEAARVGAAILQANPDLIGMAGFDSESGPGFGQAIKEAGRAGQIVATCVEAEEQHLRLVFEGVITAAIGQKRELFTYEGVRALHQVNHSPLRFTSDDRRAGIVPIPVNLSTGTYTVTKENVDLFRRPV